MQHVMNRNEILHEIRRLNVIERLNIVTDIWDEIKEAQELESVSEDEKALLLNRLANYRATPISAIDWADLRREVCGRYAEEAALNVITGLIVIGSIIFYFSLFFDDKGKK